MRRAIPARNSARRDSAASSNERRIAFMSRIENRPPENATKLERAPGGVLSSKHLHKNRTLTTTFSHESKAHPFYAFDEQINGVWLVCSQRGSESVNNRKSNCDQPDTATAFGRPVDDF